MLRRILISVAVVILLILLAGYSALRMLTTAPSARFHVESDKGRAAPGQLADLVLLGSDPAQNMVNFADVRLTLRTGPILYQKP